MNQDEKYLNTIKSVFKYKIKDFNIISGSEEKETYGNVVFEVNKKWIFRFSRKKIDLKQLEIEKSFLKKFSKISPISVPEIKFETKGLMACDKFKGGPLTKTILKSLSAKEFEGTFILIGKFLKSLHEVKFKHKDLVEYPLGDSDFKNHLCLPVAKYLSKNARSNALKYFKDYFSWQENINIEKSICHGDFHPNHIFFDEKTKKITGIIDFGRICINDPALDFNLIQRFYGQKALHICLKEYKPENINDFKKRILFQNRRRLFAAFFHAKLVGQSSSFPRYIKRIEKVFI